MSEPVLLLVPVKRWDRAKTRLSPGADPRHLAEAFARDAVSAALASTSIAQVYVVSDQPNVSFAGATVLPDEGAGNLNEAISRAGELMRADHPGAAVAVMCADLPCLVPGDLTRAVETAVAAGTPRAFVADAEGTGTTLLLVRAGSRLVPLFGAGSARRHAASGARPIPGDLRTLRRDVDTLDDLDAATQIGVGPHTRAALTR